MTNVVASIVWPLVFRYSGTILGKGFVAEVQLRGRLLARPEVEGVWLDGVNPGALSVGAPTLNEANTELRDTLTRVFIDFAQQAASFDEFSAVVEAYVHESDNDTREEWTAAVASVREGRVPTPSGLPIQSADGDVFVRVTFKPIEQVTPRDNLLIQREEQQALAAVA